MPSLDAAARPPLLTTIDEGLDTGQRDPPSMATVSTVRSCRTLCARERIRGQAREVVQQETPANCYPTPEVATIDSDNHMLPLQSPNALGQLTADLVRGTERRLTFRPCPSNRARDVSGASLISQ